MRTGTFRLAYVVITATLVSVTRVGAQSPRVITTGVTTTEKAIIGNWKSEDRNKRSKALIATSLLAFKPDGSGSLKVTTTKAHKTSVIAFSWFGKQNKYMISFSEKKNAKDALTDAQTQYASISADGKMLKLIYGDDTTQDFTRAH